MRTLLAQMLWLVFIPVHFVGAVLQGIGRRTGVSVLVTIGAYLARPSWYLYERYWAP